MTKWITRSLVAVAAIGVVAEYGQCEEYWRFPSAPTAAPSI